jgi:fructose-bisphosphate aldolase class II
MPIATPDQYAEMLNRAKEDGFAYPAINVSSSQTINAVLQGLTEAGSDGILQVTTGGADYFAGQTRTARASGALAMAAFAKEVAKNYPITVALHTDHCPKNALDTFVLPLIEASEDAVKRGEEPIFQSHMWDGSAVPLSENLEIAKELLPRIRNNGQILEVEIGVVGGEEDGVAAEINDKLYDGRRRHRDGRGARPRRRRPLHGGAHVRQRARRLQARQREAAPRAPR